MKTKTLANCFAALTLAAFAGRLNAQSNVTEFVPFDNFLNNVKAVNSTVMNRADARVRETRSFDEMRQHILRMYDGIRVNHSFVADGGTFDCIPVEQQPSVRLLGLNGIAEAPPAALARAATSGNDDDTAEGHAQEATQTESDRTADEFGNSLTCETGTFPMRRVTLEDLARYTSLREFFQKGPDGTGRPVETKPEEVTPASAAEAHKYSIFYQNVAATGGSSILNLWSPAVNTALGQRMSLSQEWYVGGSGASTQTAEVGWQVLPEKYGTQKAVLFIYWTADNYKTTGCYNTDCGVFTQTANQGILGRGFANYSTTGGPQYDMTAKFLLYQGNWWLAVNGTWIGYYPGKLYGSGQMTRNATSIQFGTESVGSTVWPGEGSGAWATQGWAKAAYQRNTFYFDTNGTPLWATLTSYTPSPTCYNTSGPFKNTSADWQVFFYLGGPGGSGC